ncbi:MAG: ATP-binding cassette domain-containing protein [Calditrichaeota bacterium]|nr:ATP-binding cassette domain-containing protein [Calditrichota bacterium]
MIDIRNLTKVYGPQRAVDDISFSVKRGEIIGFLGPNGAGKSTTMKIVTCYMPPTDGSVAVDGLDVQQHSMEVRRKIGYLPELNPLYGEMNVLDFLRYISALREIAPDRRSSRIGEMVDLCGLSEVIHKDIHELSKGYRQRVGLAQAMIHDPELLILDEPTIGLDPNQVVDIRNLIKTLGREKTVVLSTHILSEVQATCDRAVIINRGRIVADNSIAELQRDLMGRKTIIVELLDATGEAGPRFEAVNGVEEVREVFPDGAAGRTFRLTVRGDVDPRADLFNLSVSSGWKLIGLAVESRSLEDVFHQLTKAA